MGNRFFKITSILTLVIMSLTFIGCSEFSLVQSLGLSDLSIAPNQVTVAIGDTVNFAANGGVEPYIYSVFSGSGTVDPVSGSYTAPDAG